jgi:hypothetical protein
MKHSYGRRFSWILGVMALAAVLFSAGAGMANVTPNWTNYDGVDGTNARGPTPLWPMATTRA